MKKILALLFGLLLALSMFVTVGAAGGVTVVYLKDGGVGDGSSPAGALGSMQDAYAALDLTKACTVVVCGVYTQNENFDYGTEYTGSVTITSVYGGTDYRMSGAAYKFKPSRFVCYGDTRFENVDFAALGTNLLVVGQHNPVTVGEGVTMTGSRMTGGSIAKAFCILGGYQNGQGNPPSESDADTHITVLSGSKLYIVPFSREIAGEYTGTAHIHIGGNAEVQVLHGSAAYPNGITVGDVEITVTDNAHIVNFYGCTQDTHVGSYGFNWESGSIDLFEWVCSYTPGRMFSVLDKTVLNISAEAKKASNYAAIAANFDVVNDLTVPVEIPAAKSDYAGARGLYTLGLAQGYDTTGTNFGLDDSLTRVQTVVQVIRYLGVEEEVLAGTYTIPFTDVPAWAQSYVGYAYENGITSGRSATVFDPDGVVDESQFLTFMLRAIGYSDAKGDFVWNDPFALAKSIGMTDSTAAGASFDRGSAFAVSWKTLGVTVKNGSAVCSNLIAAGVFTSDQLAKAVEEAKTAEQGSSVVDTPTETKPADAEGYNVISIEEYKDKTLSGFLAQMVGFLSGYEFARNSDGSMRLAMPDSWFELCNGPYAEYNSRNKHEDKLLKNSATGLWEVWNDDDFSIDILNQYILRDMYSTYGTFSSKVIKDGWVKYNVWDMGGGHRAYGAYGLMKNKGYFPQFTGSAEYGNQFNVNGEPYIGNETLGMNAAGMPNVAVDMAEIFGSATSDRDPTLWLKFFTAMYAQAYFEDDIPTLIRNAQKVLPEGCWQSEVIDYIFELKEEYPTAWRRAVVEADRYCFQKKYDKENNHGESSVNCSMTLIGLLWGEGDYYETCKIIGLAGHGGDSTNPVGLSIVAIITGWEDLEADTKAIVNEKVWQDGRGVIVNRAAEGTKEAYWMFCQNLPERLQIAEIVDLYQENFEKILMENGGKIENGNYYIPKALYAIEGVDTVYVNEFESGTLDGFTTAGNVTVKPSAAAFSGDYALQLSGHETVASTATTTVSGLTVGETYRVSGFISVSARTTAQLFVREVGSADMTAVTVYDQVTYAKRELVFTATASTMEIGFTVPAGLNAFKYAILDELNVIRVEEESAGTATITTKPGNDGKYTGTVSVSVSADTDKEVYLKLNFANSTGKTVNVSMKVGSISYATAPFYKTGSITGADDTVYIPVIAGEGKTAYTVSLSLGTNAVYLYDAQLVTVKDRFDGV